MSWPPRFDTDTLGFLAATLIASVLVVTFAPDLRTQALVLAPFVALLGIPHGALDLRLAESLWPLPHARGLALFAVGYLGMAASILALWWLAPGIALGAFLAYSALHFAGDWRSELSIWQRPVAGTLLLSLPALFWPGDVTSVFSALAPGDVAEALTTVMQPAALISATILLAWIVLTSPVKKRILHELGGLVISAFLLPPLVYFLVYFCFLHSPRHFLDSVRTLRLKLWEGMRAALPLTVATWAMAGAAFVYSLQAGSSLNSTTLKVVFIGLAALAVPHMVLVERFWQLKR